MCGVFIVPLGDAGVEVPAIVVDALVARFEVVEEGFDVGDGFVFDVLQADDDVGDLDAGVVDVVLDVDLFAGGAEEANEGVAEDGIAEMADVRGLVGVNAGVLDDGAALVAGCGLDFVACGEGFGGGGAIEAGVDVSGACNFESSEAGDGAERGDDFLGNLAGSFFETAGQFESEGQSVFTEFGFGRLLDGEDVKLDGELVAEHGAEVGFEEFLLG